MKDRNILFKDWWRRTKISCYAIAILVSLILTVSGFFIAGKVAVDFAGSTKFEGLIKQKYPCKQGYRCEEPWLYNFDIEIDQTTQMLRNFKVNLDTYQKYTLGDKYLIIQKTGENWFRPYDFVLEQWSWWALGAIMLIFLGGWGFTFFGTVLLKSHKLNFIHDICAATFFALVGIGGMYMALTDIYTIYWGKRYEATIITKDTQRRTKGSLSYSFKVKVDGLEKQYHKVAVGHDFYNEHKLGEKVFVLVNPYINSAIIHGGSAYEFVIIGLLLMFVWLFVFYKIPKYRGAPIERRFPSKFDRQLDTAPKMITSTRTSHKEFDLELSTALGDINETYKKGYKNFCLDIAKGRNNILQIVSPHMFDPRQKHEMGFVVCVTFDSKNDEQEEFLKMPIAKEFVPRYMVEGVDCYGLTLNNDQAGVAEIIKDLLLEVWGVQPNNCKVSWWASLDVNK